MIDIRAVDLNLLLVFEQLMSELNATRAAAKLGVTQSAVSASLAKLRRLYGDPLLERTQRGLRPTARAILLQPLISEALALIGGTLGEAGQGGDPRARTAVVRLGLSDDFEMAFGARIVAAVEAAVPEARLVFRQANRVVAAAALNEREIDLALTAGTGDDTRLKHEALGDSGFAIVFDKTVREDLAPMPLDEFLARDQILVSYSGLSGLVDDVLAEHGLRRTVRVSTTHFSSLPHLLRGSGAITTIPEHAARAMLETGPFALSPCPLPFPRYAYGLSWRFDAVRHPVILRVRDAVASVFRRIP